MAKKYFSFTYILLACLLGMMVLGVAHQALALENTYVPVPNATTPTGANENSLKLTSVIQYGFWFIIAVAGIIAVVAIAWGGFKILLFPTDPSVRSDAWDRIWNAALGLALLFLTVIILTTINPDLVKLKVGGLDPLPAPVQGMPQTQLLTLPTIAPTLPLLSQCRITGAHCTPPGVCVGSRANIFSPGVSMGTCRDVQNPGPNSCLTAGATCELRPGASDLPCCRTNGNPLTCREGWISGLVGVGTCQ